MADNQQNEDIATRRKRLRFRAWHRGMKEMDIILGNFADRHIDELSAEELDQLETLMEQPDRDIYTWIAGEKPLPDAFRTPVMERLMAFELPQRTPLDR